MNFEAHRTREPALSINWDQNADQPVEEQAAVIAELQPVREQAPLGFPLTPAGTDRKIRQYAEIDHQKQFVHDPETKHFSNMTTSVDIFFNLQCEDEVEAAHKIKTHTIRRVNAVWASVWQ